MGPIGRLPILAVLVAIGVSLTLASGSRTGLASPANLNVHVHDDFYHPAGAFIVGTSTNHTVAQLACQKANPDSACDAVIFVGDTITWVAPSPLAANVHSVTECTDNTFSVCGPSVAPASPIGDSGLRSPPPAVAPAGWPYGPIQFNADGVFYYRCEVHPDVMRGRIIVNRPAGTLGGVAFYPDRGGDDLGSSAMAAIAGGAVAAAIALGGAAWYTRRRLVALAARSSGSEDAGSQ